MTSQFTGKTLADLNVLHTSITARLNEFLNAGNAEQSITYARLQAECSLEMQKVISAKLEALKSQYEPSAAEQVAARVYSSPTPPRVVEDW